MQNDPKKSARILIVDDQDGNILLFGRVLASAGYTQYRTLTDPRQVIAVFQEWNPDLIVLDLMMPYMDGFEVMRQLQSLVPFDSYLPILAITGDVSVATRQRALSEGAKDFLNKPIDISEVLLRIANLLETRFLYLKVQDQNLNLENTVRERTREVQEQATLIAKARDAIMVRDVDDSIAFWNEGAERLYGWTHIEAVGRNAPQLLGSNAAQAQEAHNALLARGEWAGEMRQVTKAGKDVIVMSSWTLLRNEAGQPKSIMVINSDITNQKNLEAQILHGQRMIGVGMVASGVAHDFNNLLTAIMGFTEMVIGGMKAEDPARDLLHEVYKAGERAATLTRQLLAFSRKQDVEVQVLDINNLIADAEKILCRLIGEKIRMITDVEPNLGLVRADAGQIEMILLNLCVNARDAMPLGGQITVTTRNVELDRAYMEQHPYVAPGLYVELAVQDTGSGMNEATKARAFEPFFTTKEKSKGTGLGLAMVYRIVKQSGGSIEIDSAPGNGAKFQIYLPRVDEAAAAAATSLSGEFRAPRGTETVLLVDHDDAVRALSRLALQSFGYSVLDAADGTAALRVSVEHTSPIHLVITDVVMPEMSGGMLVERLQAVRPELKVLYASGYTDDIITHNGVAVDSAAFIAKPITPGMLARKVRAVLDENRSVRSFHQDA